MKQELPIIAAKHPFKVEVKAGQKYSWCSCGASKKQPFCDGLHKNYRDENGDCIMKSVKYIAQKDEVIFFCGCKKSKNGIFCDGSHKYL